MLDKILYPLLSSLSYLLRNPEIDIDLEPTAETEHTSTLPPLLPRISEAVKSFFGSKPQAATETTPAMSETVTETLLGPKIQLALGALLVLGAVLITRKKRIVRNVEVHVPFRPQQFTHPHYAKAALLDSQLRCLRNTIDN